MAALPNPLWQRESPGMRRRIACQGGPWVLSRLPAWAQGEGAALDFAVADDGARHGRRPDTLHPGRGPSWRSP